MPFARNSELPKGVRNSLPAAAQTVWRNVFNSQEKRGLSDERSARSAWSTLRRQGWRPPPESAPEGAKWRKLAKAGHKDTDADIEERRRRRKKRQRLKSKKSVFGLPSEQNRVKNNAMTKSFETTAEVLKIDEELGIVFGWGIVCTEKGEPYFDMQGDHITEDAMMKATSDFMYAVRTAGEMHARDDNGDAIHKGVIVHSMPLTMELVKAFGIKIEKTGWFIGMKPDKDMLEKFKDGTYKGFSIGGSRGIDEDAD